MNDTGGGVEDLMPRAKGRDHGAAATPSRGGLPKGSGGARGVWADRQSPHDRGDPAGSPPRGNTSSPRASRVSPRDSDAAIGGGSGGAEHEGGWGGGWGADVVTAMAGSKTGQAGVGPSPSAGRQQSADT
jgi:hypothetical protein